MYKLITGLAGLLFGGLAGCLSAPDVVWPPNALTGHQSLSLFILAAAAGLGVGVIGGGAVDRRAHRTATGRMTRWTAAGSLFGAVGSGVISATFIGPIIAWGTAAVGCLAGAVTGFVAALLVGPGSRARRRPSTANEPDARAAETTMYCAGCSYVLDGLPEPRCPECGRRFDPARPRTFRRLPQNEWWIRRAGYTAVAMLVVLAAGLAMIQRALGPEAEAIRQIHALGGSVNALPIGPTWIPKWVERYLFGPRLTVTRVRLNGKLVTDDDLQHLEGLTNLTGLWLGDTQVTSAGLAHIRRLTKLQTLGLEGTRVTDEGLVHLKDLVKLAVIDFRRTRITGVGFSHLVGMSNLSWLYLSHTRITDAALIRLKGLPALQSLNLKGTGITDDGMGHIAAMPNLSLLSLTETAVTDAGLARLSTLNFIWLFLNDTNITDDGLLQLREMAQLRYLQLDGTAITDAGLAHLVPLKRLHTLTLRRTRVTDAGLAHLGGLRRLAKLDLEGTAITDTGLRQLQALRLTDVNLSGTQVTRDGVQALMRARPTLAIHAIDDVVDW